MSGDLSALTGAVDVPWPELTLDELRGLAPPGCAADDRALARVLEATGGHPAVARELLATAVGGSTVLWAALMALIRRVRPPNDRERISKPPQKRSRLAHGR